MHNGDTYVFLYYSSDTEDEKAYKNWKKSIMLVWRSAANHKSVWMISGLMYYVKQYHFMNIDLETHAYASDMFLRDDISYFWRKVYV